MCLQDKQLSETLGAVPRDNTLEVKAFTPGRTNRNQAMDNLESERRCATALRAKPGVGATGRLRAGGAVCLAERWSPAAEPGSPGCSSRAALTVCHDPVLNAGQIPGEAQASAPHIKP